MHGGDDLLLQHAGGNTTSDHQLHHLIDLWATARAMVVRIEGFALVLLSFFVVIFGSCRRWSNRWIIQKGFLAASALSVSLGTYSIGLMQSSSVKSKMYPVWSVSLLALFASVDSINTYSIDYSGQLLKMMYQLCLYFGYVLLITISTAASSDAAVNAAIGVLCAITLCKGIHGLMAYVFPSKLRSMSQEVAQYMEIIRSEGGWPYIVFLPDGNATDLVSVIGLELPANQSILYAGAKRLTMDEVWKSKSLEKLGDDVHSYKDICLSFSLCHLLQRRFYGLHCAESGMPGTRNFLFEGLLRCHRLPSPAGPSQQQTEITEEEKYDPERAFKVIEAELGFLYDYMYSSDAFLYYYEAGVSTAWALASILGLCFLCLVVAARAQPSPPEAAAQVGKKAGAVDTTTADIVITIVLLVSLASLQVLQLVRCWSSNWAKLSLACRLAKKEQSRMKETVGRRMRLKAAFLGRMKWLDQYQWQNKLGQLSLVHDSSSTCKKLLLSFAAPLRDGVCRSSMCPTWLLCLCCLTHYYLFKMFGLQYIRQALRDTLGYGPGASIDLTPDVKRAIVLTLERFAAGPLTNGSSSLQYNGVMHCFEWAFTPAPPSFSPSGGGSIFPKLNIKRFWREPLPSVSWLPSQAGEDNQATVILTWHIATCHCDRAYRGTGLKGRGLTEEDMRRIKRYHGVATSLSKYCAYLVAYVPELLPGQQSYTRTIYDDAVRRRMGPDLFEQGEELGKQLLSGVLEENDELRRWKVLAEFWAEMLLYLAPAGNVTAHMERLAHGGEFITHLWALLFHGGILSPAANRQADEYLPERIIIE